MTNLRFEVGALLMCNMGPAGWKLGKIIALNYRESQWPSGKTVPYQVLLEGEHALIYVPEDDERYCKRASLEDLRVARRSDALATADDPVLPSGSESGKTSRLDCSGEVRPGAPDYRSGKCQCTSCCPRNWSAVELYSEHYRAVARSGLKVTRREVDLGRVRVGDSLHHAALEGLPKEGFLQAPTLVRLPPGVRFADDGSLSGEVHFDPHREETYEVGFVAVSTADWRESETGVVRLEISFVVEGNAPPEDFNMDAFSREQQRTRSTANAILDDIIDVWQEWDRGELSNRDTCDQMCTDLGRLRTLLEKHPRLDNGKWWAQLGGFHMNVHKLLENTLFECELYLGHALTFGNPAVRQMAEQNLEGCYQKRLLEAARFLWIDAVKQMMRSDWSGALKTLERAAEQKDGWGWAVNYGDIWFTEAAVRLIQGAELDAAGDLSEGERSQWMDEVETLLKKSLSRSKSDFGPQGHPWAYDLGEALSAYRMLKENGTDTIDWLSLLKQRTTKWCGLVLGGAEPFPPQPRPRNEDAAALIQRLPGHNSIRATS